MFWCVNDLILGFWWVELFGLDEFWLCVFLGLVCGQEQVDDEDVDCDLYDDEVCLFFWWYWFVQYGYVDEELYDGCDELDYFDYGEVDVLGFCGEQQQWYGCGDVGEGEEQGVWLFVCVYCDVGCLCDEDELDYGDWDELEGFQSQIVYGVDCWVDFFFDEFVDVEGCCQ